MSVFLWRFGPKRNWTYLDSDSEYDPKLEDDESASEDESEDEEVEKSASESEDEDEAKVEASDEAASVVDLTIEPPGCAYACALGEWGVPACIMRRIDFGKFVRRCEKATSQNITDAKTTVANGKRAQYHLDETKEGKALLKAVLKRKNAADEGREYAHVWNDLMNALRGKITALLSKKPFHMHSALVFSGCSILVQDSDEATDQQAPHTDFAGGVQCVMACTPDTKPTLVYTEPLVDHDIPRTAEEQRLYDASHVSLAAEMSLKTLAKHKVGTVLNAMKPAADRLLQPGEFSCLLGPVIHAGPGIPKGTRRIVLFITAHLEGQPPYDVNEQHSAVNAALTLRSSKLAVRRAIDYNDRFKLWTTENGGEGEVLRKLVCGLMTKKKAVKKLQQLDTQVPPRT